MTDYSERMLATLRRAFFQRKIEWFPLPCAFAPPSFSVETRDLFSSGPVAVLFRDIFLFRVVFGSLPFFFPHFAQDGPSVLLKSKKPAHSLAALLSRQSPPACVVVLPSSLRRKSSVN